MQKVLHDRTGESHPEEAHPLDMECINCEIKRQGKRHILFIFSLLFTTNGFSQFFWTGYANHATNSRGRTFTRDAYTYSTAGVGTLAGNTMTTRVSHVGPNQGSDITNFSLTCGSGANNQIHTSTEYFSTGALDPCLYRCPPTYDPGLTAVGLWVGVDWPDKTSSVDIDLAFTLPVFNANFDIYDINQNVVFLPFADLLVISGVTCSGTTVYPVSVTNLDPPYSYTPGTGTLAPTNNTTLGVGGNYATVTFPNVGLVSIKISYYSNPTIPAPDPADPDYQYIILKELQGTSSASTPLAVAASSTVLCSGGSATLTAGSGYTSYSWNPGGATTQSITVAPGVGTNTYTVVASNAGGCPVSATTTISVSPPPVANVSSATICGGQNATLTASGGGDYSWSSGQTTSAISVAPTTNATYSVIVSIGSCTDTAVGSVSVTSGITATAGPNTTICSGQNATLGATGGGTYSWSNGATTSGISISPTITTTYSVTVTNGLCTDTSSAVVTVSSALPPIISGNTSLCAGDVATLTASGGATYLWNTGATATVITVNPTTATFYTVTATSAAGCVSSNTVSVIIAPPPVASANNVTLCSGQTATLTASGGGNYSWSNGSTTNPLLISPTTNTTYSVIVSIGSCSDTAFSTATVLPGVTANISGNTSLCAGDMTTLTASGGVNYSWNNGSTSNVITASPTTTTGYAVIVSNASGCSATAILLVTVSPPPVASAVGITVCAGQNATLTAFGGGNYSWSNGSSSNPLVVTPTSASTYSVIVSIGSCSDTASASVGINPSPTPSASGDITIVQGQSTVLSASGGTNYVWNNGETGANISVSPSVTMQYCATVINSYGCADSACVWVAVLDMDCSAAKLGELFIPNAFSPNGDGENETLLLYYGNYDCIKEYTFVVYSRWGEKVFETEHPAESWDGTYSRSENSGLFAWYMKAVLLNGTKIEKKGNVCLMR